MSWTQNKEESQGIWGTVLKDKWVLVVDLSHSAILWPEHWCVFCSGTEGSSYNLDLKKKDNKAARIQDLHGYFLSGTLTSKTLLLHSFTTPS